MSTDTDRSGSRHVYLRVALAAFVLALYTSLALATGGVAHADDDAPHSKQATSDGPSHSKPDRGKDKRAQHRTPKADEPTTPDAQSDAADAPRATKTKAPKPTSVNAPTQTKTPVPTETNDPKPTDAPEEQPAATQKPVDAKRQPKPRLTAVATPKTAEPRPTVTAATTAPTLRTHTTTAPLAAAPSSAPTPKLAAVPDVAPKDPALQPGIDRQIQGLVSDVETVALAAVHSAATVVAQAFGPTSFLGVPYMLATTVANAAAGAARTLVGALPSDESTGPFTTSYGLLDGIAFLNPTKSPPGANDPSITTTAAHPLPVILINGTIETQGANWSVGAPVLANAGYKVYTFNYGNTTSDLNAPFQSLADIKSSAKELSDEVDQVLKETGAPKVILVGHSQGGGILPVYYINELGGADKVSQLIGIDPSNHGTDFNGLAALTNIPILGSLAIGIANLIGPALIQQTIGSPFQDEVYGQGDTRGDVLYTTIATVNDEVVTPYTQQALIGPNVTNVVLQQLYPGVVLGHINAMLAPQTWAVVLDALASNAAANPDLAGQTSAA